MQSFLLVKYLACLFNMHPIPESATTAVFVNVSKSLWCCSLLSRLWWVCLSHTLSVEGYSISNKWVKLFVLLCLVHTASKSDQYLKSVSLWLDATLFYNKKLNRIGASKWFPWLRECFKIKLPCSKIQNCKNVPFKISLTHPQNYKTVLNGSI